MLNNFAPIYHDYKFAGDLLQIRVNENSLCFVFFGSRHLSWETLPKLFPQFSFVRLKQIHGQNIVRAETGVTPEADSHWTHQTGLALCIVTADCLPVLILDSHDMKIAAVHAGWRGIENQIVLKTISAIRCQRPEALNIFIGPHIRSESFEVGNDVAQRISISTQMFPRIRPTTFIFEHPNPEKKYLSLEALLNEQLVETGVLRDSIISLNKNTYVSTDHASYRRKDSGRQISFIALTTA